MEESDQLHVVRGSAKLKGCPKIILSPLFDSLLSSKGNQWVWGSATCLHTNNSLSMMLMRHMPDFARIMPRLRFDNNLLTLMMMMMMVMVMVMMMLLLLQLYIVFLQQQLTSSHNQSNSGFSTKVKTTTPLESNFRSSALSGRQGWQGFLFLSDDAC